MSFEATAADHRTKDALREIMRERVRQEGLWGVQHLGFTPPVGTTPEMEFDIKAQVKLAVQEDKLSWWDVLTEELVEAMVAALQGDMDACREELIHVAAVACAAIEDLDSRGQE